MLLQLPAGARRLGAVARHVGRHTGRPTRLGGPAAAAAAAAGCALAASCEGATPEGEWTPHKDPASGRTYYHNTRTGTTTWDRPVSPVVAAGSSALKVVFLPDSPGEDPRYLFPSLTDAFPSASFVFPATAEEAAAELRDAHAAMGQLPPDMLEASGGAPQLRLLQSPQAAPPAGYYYEALARHQCSISNMRGTFNDQLPLHILTMLLTLNRNFHLYRDQQREHVYQQVPDNAPLDEKSTALVVGVGAAGMEAARLCKQVFGMRVVGVDSGRASSSEWLDSLHMSDELDALLGEADAVIVTIPHTPETEGLFDASKFAQMKPNTLFINIVRLCLLLGRENASMMPLLSSLKASADAGAGRDRQAG